MPNRLPLLAVFGICCLWLMFLPRCASAQTQITQIPCNYEISGVPYKNSCSATDITGVPGGGPYLPLSGGAMSGAITSNATATPLTLGNSTSAVVALVGGGATYDFKVGVSVGTTPASLDAGEIGQFNDNSLSTDVRAITLGVDSSGNGYVRSPHGTVDFWSVATLIESMAASGAIYSVNVSAPGYGVNAAAGTARQITFQSSGSNRWAVNVDNTAETGGSAGSNFDIGRYNDSGGYVDLPFYITRSSGLVNIAYLSVNNTGYIQQPTFGTNNVGTFSAATIAGLTGGIGSNKMGVQWNYSNGGGETDFFINHSSGLLGGLAAYDINAAGTAITNLFSATTSSFTLPVVLTANGTVPPYGSALNIVNDCSAYVGAGHGACWSMVYPGVSTKSFRIDSNGALNFINSAYNQVVDFLYDSGAMTIGNGATIGTGGIALALVNAAGTCNETPGGGSLTVSCSSDERLKKDITKAPDELAFLMSFVVHEYTLKASGERIVGVVAQEVEKTHPKMVHRVETPDKADSKDPNVMLSVDTPSTWVLVKAIQQEADEIDILKKDVRLLKRQVKALRRSHGA